jgi:exopolysaccharide biosynthesis polyprenyl glycosylphosphotransferase
VREVGFGRGTLLIKRAVDIVGAAVGLTLGAPILGLIALAIRLDSPGPTVFRQTRVGAGGKLFEIYKFRSMREGAEAELEQLLELNEADGPIFKIRDDPRLTRVGRFLRRTSLDELPQLWNVLRGEMSLVGPRPPIPSEVEGYQEWHKKRLDGRPGVTGLWQISGRSLLSFDEQVLLDIYYIENWSLWLDFKILLRTVPQVLFGDGAY